MKVEFSLKKKKKITKCLAHFNHLNQKVTRRKKLHEQIVHSYLSVEVHKMKPYMSIQTNVSLSNEEFHP